MIASESGASGPLGGRTALVTGGGTGIGRAIAVALAQAGARVAVTYRTHAPDAELAAALGTDRGGAPLAFAPDLAQDEEVAAFARELHTALDAPLDILVNNAGGLVQRSTIAEMDAALWHRIIGVNLDSTFLVTHHVLSFFGDGGRIVNVASLAGRNGGHPGATAYASSKAAIFGFTRGLAKELAPRGITVNALAPGFIEATPFHDTFTTADSKAQTIGTIPLGRAGVPADIASAVLWLASAGAGFVSGSIVDVNGAQYFG